MTGTAHGSTGSTRLPVAMAAFSVIAFGGIGGLALVAQLLVAGTTESTAGPDAAEIPADYLVTYRAASSRYHLGADGWSVLAAVGKVECDHGRSPLEGCGRGEHNSAGAMGPAQFLAATWERYGVDGDHDGDRDAWNPVDAIFGMANYLRASGAPRDWRAALFAYNHAGWYVDRVLAQAARYRDHPPGLGASTPTSTAPFAGRWIVPLPGFPGERCDARIVRDVITLTTAFRLRVSDCFGGAPHAVGGEHPLGLAIDAVPEDGDWDHAMALARAFGWREACAASGCPGRGPFRVILYNGYPSHGDPRHSRIPHIHVSWQHAPAAPFTAASWVRTLTPGAASVTTTPPGSGGGR